MARAICTNVSGLGLAPLPRWRSAPPGPDNRGGVDMRQFAAPGWQGAGSTG